MEIKENYLNENRQGYSERTVARELATITCILAQTQRQAEKWESLITNKGKASEMP